MIKFLAEQAFIRDLPIAMVVENMVVLVVMMAVVEVVAATDAQGDATLWGGFILFVEECFGTNKPGEIKEK